MSMCKSLTALLALSLAAGCSSRPANCAQAKKELGDCLDKHPGEYFEGMVNHCLPATPTENFKGVAAFDFEYSRFFEGARSVPADAWWNVTRPLLYLSDEAPERPAPSHPGWATAVAIEFKGRRVPCEAEIFEGEQTIVADEVVSQKLLQERPSLYP